MLLLREGLFCTRLTSRRVTQSWSCMHSKVFYGNYTEGETSSQRIAHVTWDEGPASSAWVPSELTENEPRCCSPAPCSCSLLLYLREVFCRSCTFSITSGPHAAPVQVLTEEVNKPYLLNKLFLGVSYPNGVTSCCIPACIKRFCKFVTGTFSRPSARRDVRRQLTICHAGLETAAAYPFAVVWVAR